MCTSSVVSWVAGRSWVNLTSRQPHQHVVVALCATSLVLLLLFLSAGPCSAPMTAAAFYVIQLQGSFGFFYLMYLSTLILGVGEFAGFIPAERCLLLQQPHGCGLHVASWKLLPCVDTWICCQQAHMAFWDCVQRRCCVAALFPCPCSAWLLLCGIQSQHRRCQRGECGAQEADAHLLQR
jgi:hypothetical protein